MSELFWNSIPCPAPVQADFETIFIQLFTHTLHINNVNYIVLWCVTSWYPTWFALSDIVKRITRVLDYFSRASTIVACCKFMYSSFLSHILWRHCVNIVTSLMTARNVWWRHFVVFKLKKIYANRFECLF